jgi:hypothetical protein
MEMLQFPLCSEARVGIGLNPPRFAGNPFVRKIVAQVVNLPYRRLAVGGRPFVNKARVGIGLIFPPLHLKYA